MYKLSIAVIASTIVFTAIAIGYFGNKYFGRKRVQIFGTSVIALGAAVQILRVAPQYRNFKFSKR